MKFKLSTAIKYIYIAAVIYIFFRCLETMSEECEPFIELHFMCVYSYLLKKAFDVFCKYLPTPVGRPVETLFKVKSRYSWLGLFVMYIALVQTESHRLGVAICQCYAYYGIRKLYRLVVSYGFPAPETVVITARIDHVAATAAPTPAIDVVTPVIDVATDTEPVATVTVEPVATVNTEPATANTEPVAIVATEPDASASAAKLVDNKSELDLGPKFCPDSHFSRSITILNTWIKKNGFNELSCIHPTNLRNFFEIDFKRVSTSILIELFTFDRSSRLKALLQCVNETTEEEESIELATAVSRMMVQSFGFPGDTDTYMHSYFQFVVPMLAKTLQSCRDSFVCDFVLYNLVEFPTADLFLKDDFLEGGVNWLVDKQEVGRDIEEFLSNAIMRPTKKPKMSLRGVLTYIASGIRRWMGSPDTESPFVKLYTGCVGKKIKEINTALEIEINKRMVPLVDSPVSTGDGGSPTSLRLRQDKRRREDFEKRDMGFYTNFSPEDFEKINTALLKAAEDAGSSSSLQDKLNMKAINEFMPSHTDPDAINRIPSESKEDMLSDYDFLNYRPNVPEKGVPGTDFGVFEDDVMDVRLIDTEMREKLNKLFKSEWVVWLNQVRELSEEGRTSSKTTEVLQQVRGAFLEVIENMKRYQAYVTHFEKEYVVRQLVRFVKMYKHEIKRVRKMNSEKIKEKGNKSRILLYSLRNLTVASTCNAWNLKYVFERFVVGVPQFYDNDVYKERIEDVYNYMFKLGKERMGIEERD
ncbi:hypothetical protein EDC94DRAFT_597503 [Helicostylum pulchrum]|nr:hypothetical protein EDC94DRAFT_597503 [Helicostylum pulchrum]